MPCVTIFSKPLCLCTTFLATEQNQFCLNSEKKRLCIGKKAYVNSSINASILMWRVKAGKGLKAGASHLVTHWNCSPWDMTILVKQKRSLPLPNLWLSWRKNLVDRKRTDPARRTLPDKRAAAWSKEQGTTGGRSPRELPEVSPQITTATSKTISHKDPPDHCELMALKELISWIHPDDYLWACNRKQIKSLFPTFSTRCYENHCVSPEES